MKTPACLPVLVALLCTALASAAPLRAEDGRAAVRGQIIDDSDTVVHGSAPNTEERAAPAADAVPFRISVDGVPIEENTTRERLPESQRRTDVALAQADIQIKFDPLQVKPALNVWSYPRAAVRGAELEFLAYANYASWITKAEVRIFRHDSRPRGDGR